MSLLASIAYAGRSIERPRYHANDASRDSVDIVPADMAIADMRGMPCGIDAEGFQLMSHVSAVTSFEDGAQVAALHPREIEDLLMAVSGADRVIVNSPGILRFSERSGRAGSLDNSRPARFAHVDISDATAAQFVQMATKDGPKPAVRAAHYNVWRAITPPPQDVPLALCDARSVATQDLIAADAVFDAPGKPEWSFEGWVVAHNPAHRWCYFSEMTRDEVIVFRTNDSDPARAHCVPHVAFDHPGVGKDAPPRASIEMRGIALWFA